MQSSGVVELHRLLTEDTVRIGLVAETKDEVIDRMVDLLRGHPAVRDLEAARRAVFEREQVMSTGVGKGLALPHAKCEAVDGTVAAFAVTREPIEFGSIDDEPVRLVFLLIGAEGAKSQHIKMLSRISRLMNRDEFREQLLNAGSAETVVSIFEAGEAQLQEA
jgi:mannitol/fructose-specific phosphotransferase system IIA component (Ntr-type)